MAILFISIVLIAGFALIIGSAVTEFLGTFSTFDRSADRIVISIWLGIVLLANSFFTIALFCRLSPPVTIGFTSLVLLLALLRKECRTFLAGLPSAIPLTAWCGSVAVVLGTAAYCSQVIVWYDSGLYHLQYIKWLSDVGIVPGIGLIHWRLGISSSWYALHAPFNHGVFAGRMFSLGGGLCMLMLLLQAGVAVSRICRRQGRRQDLFMACATLLTIPVLLVWGMPNSPTSDLPVICLEIIIAWAILALSDDTGKLAVNSDRHSSLIVLILAAGAFSMKLSAAPLVAIAFLFYLFHRSADIRKLVSGLVAIALLLAPLAGAGLIISGCAFFPSTAFCIDTPWALGKTIVAEKSKIIQDWAKWGGRPTPAGASGLDWLRQWVRTEKIGTGLIAVSLCSAISLLVFARRRSSSSGIVTVVAIGLAGPAFMLCTAPSWRFGLGYLVLLPALATAIFGEHAIRSAAASPLAGILGNPVKLGIVTAAAVSLHSHLVPRPSYRLLDGYFSNNQSGDKAHFNLIFPPRIQNICFEVDPVTVTSIAMTQNPIASGQAVDFAYVRPADSETCWDAPLPCAVEPLDTIALRDRQRGIAGGFIRKNID